MDLDTAKKFAGYKVAPWRTRLREIFWGHTDFNIKKVELQYVDDSKKPKYDMLEIAVLVLLVINMIVLGVFDPLQPNSVQSEVAQWIDLSLSILFFIEAIIRYLSFGLIAFTGDKWNMADGIIVILSLVASILEASGTSFGNFTILRTVRVFRPLRSVTTLPAAKSLVLSIYSAVKSLEDVTVLYILFIISFSIIGVTQFMGRLRTRCVRDQWMPFSQNKTQFLLDQPQFGYAENFTLPDFVCGGKIESQSNSLLGTSVGCGLEITCNNAQFIGNRILTGYTCPFGYKCLDVGNPMFGYVSFDSVPQAMLTIFVGVTAEGLYRVAFQMMDSFDVTAAYFFLAIHILGTFFIVNLSVVLVTVTFEHVSSRLKENQPHLVSKMQQILQSGPRIVRRQNVSRRAQKIALTAVTEDGAEHHGTIHEEYAYLVPEFGDDEDDLNDNTKLATFGEVAQRALQMGNLSRDNLRRWAEIEEEEMEVRKVEDEDETLDADEIVKRRKARTAARLKAQADKEEAEREAKEREAQEKKERRQRRRRARRLRKGRNPDESDSDDSKDEESDDDGGDDKKTKEEQDAWTRRLDEAESIKPMRQFLDRFIKDHFESILNALILINIAVMCTQHYGQSQFMSDFFEYSNIVFAALFGLEFLIKVLHYGPRRYFIVPMNVFDFGILVFAIVDVSTAGLFPSVTALRAIRLLKIMKSFPGILRWTVVILVSIKSSLLLLATIFVVNYCFAMFGMHMFGAKFCDLATEVDFRPDNTLSWCPNRPRANFDDVPISLLTTFQLMTGDNWDVIMYNAMRSRSWVVALAFVGYIILMTFVLVNILVGILLSGPSPQEVDLIGQKLFGISFIAKQQEEQEAAEARARANSTGNLEQWEENVRAAQGGKTAARIDLMAFAERTMSAVPRKFLDSLEAVEDTIMLQEHASALSNQRRSFQRFLREALQSRLVENIMLLLLSVSSLALAFETPESAPDHPRAIILKILDIVFSVLFMLEILLNFYAFGIIKEPDSYLRRDPWNVLDTFLVLTNLFGTSAYFYFRARWLRVLLAVRAVRPLRFVKRSQGLRTVFTAFAMSIVPLKNVVFLAIVIWTCWGLMGVQLFMGAFYSCSNSSLTTKATCLASISENVIRYNYSNINASATTTMFNVSSTTSTAAAAGTTTLMATAAPIIIGNWTETIMRPSPYTWTNADLHFDHLGASYLSLLVLASLDGGADIMINGMDSVGMDVAPEVNHRVRVAFYFVSFIFIGGYFLVNLVVSVIIDTYNKEKMKNGDNGIFLTANQNTFLRSHRRILHGVPQIFYDDHDVSDLRRNMRQIVSAPWFRHIATAVSLVNGCLLLADYYSAPQGLRTTILICNFTFGLVFSAEVAVKMISLGPKRFFHSRFNRFDLFVTMCVFVGVIGEVALPDRGYTFVFRAMRSISLFRVVRNAEKLRRVISRFSYSLYGLANVGALLFIFLYIFGVMGVKSFGLVRYHGSLSRQTNFDNVFRAGLLLLNALAGGGWAANMNDCAVEPPRCDNHIADCGVMGWAQAYFVLFVIFTKFVLLNMFIAVILDSFVSTDYEQVAISKQHVREFFEKWMMLDPSMTLRIDSRQLVPFLRCLSPDNPLGFGGSELTRKIGHEFKFIQHLRLHEMDDSTIELQDLITALCDATLGTPLPDSEVRALQQYADHKFHRKERDLYIGKRAQQNSRRVIERFAVHVIEQHWIEFKYRIGKRTGRVGVASLLRSRAGEQDFASRRDNLSFVDQDNQSMWAGMDRDSGDDFDDDDDYYNDTASGQVRREEARERHEAEKRARAIANHPIDSRPQLKQFLHDMAKPLIAKHNREQTGRLLAEGGSHVVAAVVSNAHRPLVGGSQQHSNAQDETESHDLMKLLSTHETSEWHEQRKRILEHSLANNLPLGGRLLHAQRVVEKEVHALKAAEMQDAERAFAEATDDAHLDDEHEDHVRVDHEDSLHRSHGLVPQTGTWRRVQPHSKPEHHLHNDHPEHRHRHPQRDHAHPHDDDLTSPTSQAFNARRVPEAFIPGTMSAAARTGTHAPAAQRHERLFGLRDNNNMILRKPRHPLKKPERVGGPVTLVFGDGPFVTDFDERQQEQEQQQQQQNSEMEMAILSSSRPSSPTTSMPLEMIHITRPSSPAKLRRLGDRDFSKLQSQPGDAAASSSSATTSNALDLTRIPPSATPARVSIDDDIEMKILLQEVKEWRGEDVSHNKVTRPPGYHSHFTPKEYASL